VTWLKLTSTETADWASHRTGEFERFEYFDTQTKDGTNVGEHLTKREAVLPSEFLNLPDCRVLKELLEPVLADAVSEDRCPRWLTAVADMDGITALVLRAAEGLDIGVARKGHEVVTKPFKLVVIGDLFQAVDDGVCGHSYRENIPQFE
jgi:hypothetical protein